MKNQRLKKVAHGEFHNVSREAENPSLIWSTKNNQSEGWAVLPTAWLS